VILSRKMNTEDFFMFARKLSFSEDIKKVWNEIYYLDREILELQRRRKKLSTVSIIVGNNILRNKKDKH